MSFFDVILLLREGNGPEALKMLQAILKRMNEEGKKDANNDVL